MPGAFLVIDTWACDLLDFTLHLGNVLLNQRVFYLGMRIVLQWTVAPLAIGRHP